MTARETEALQLARCLSVAHGQAANACAENEREAHLFGLSATLTQTRFPQAARRLREASERFFSQSSSKPLPSADVVQKGWVMGLPRWRDMLVFHLQRQQST